MGSSRACRAGPKRAPGPFDRQGARPGPVRADQRMGGKHTIGLRRPAEDQRRRFRSVAAASPPGPLPTPADRHDIFTHQPGELHARWNRVRTRLIPRSSSARAVTTNTDRNGCALTGCNFHLVCDGPSGKPYTYACTPSATRPARSSMLRLLINNDAPRRHQFRITCSSGDAERTSRAPLCCSRVTQVPRTTRPDGARRRHAWASGRPLRDTT